MNNITVDQLVELAKEVESEDPIDWGYLSINEEEAYKLIALSLLEHKDRNPNILLAIITKLTVENMVLNLKLMQNRVGR
jgi:hypothetical protein